MSAWKLNPNDSIPLHAQMAQRITAQIDAGAFKPGDRLPSERELMGLANVSRATVRQALLSLVHHGVLEKIHGSGTFVAYPRYEQPLQSVYSFSEQFRLSGQTLDDTLLRRAVLQADALLAERLSIVEGANVILIRRLRALRDKPIMLSNAYIPETLAPALATDPLEGSLYRLLAEVYGRPVLRAVDRLEAIRADRPVAALLEVPVGAALMYVERWAYTTGDVTLHIGENYIRGDMVRFRTELQADQSAGLEIKLQDIPKRP